MEFIECDEPVNLSGNKTRDETVTGGCYKVCFYNGTLMVNNVLHILI